MSVLEIPNFTDPEKVDAMVAAVKATSQKLSYTNTNMYHPVDVNDPLLADRVKEIIRNLSAFYEEDLVEDYTVIFEQFEGAFQPLHADSEREENGEWVPNHSAQRSHVGLLYLTDEGVDHEGGILRLPNQDELEYAPRKGLLVGFPSTHEYVHEVTKVTKGTRYAMAVWTSRA